MPFALSIGVPYDVFWHLTPNKLPSFYKAYELKRKIQDENMWIMGQYIMSALDSTVCNNSFWKGKNGKPSKYIEKPIMSDGNIVKKELTEEEKQAKLDVFVMSLKIMESNFKAEHKNKKGGKEDGKV